MSARRLSPDQEDRIVAAVLTAGVVASWRVSTIPTEDGAPVSVGPEPVAATQEGLRLVGAFYRGMLALVRREHEVDRRAGSDSDQPA